MKKLVPVLLGLVLALSGGLLGEWRARQATKEAVAAALRAARAQEQLAKAVELVGQIAVERDSLRREADKYRALRQAKTGKAVSTLAALGPPPAVKPDTCLEWVARADSLDAVAVLALSALRDADEESDALRENLRLADSTNAVLLAAIGTAESVLAEHEPRPAEGLLKRLSGVLVPVAQAGYGVLGSFDAGGRLRVNRGAYFSVGWELQVSLASVFR